MPILSRAAGPLLLLSLWGCTGDPSSTTADNDPAQLRPAKSAKSAPVKAKKASAKAVGGSATAVAWTTVSTKTDDPAAVRQAVAEASGVPVVYIGATWCGPCKQYKAALSDERMVKAHAGAHIVELDADKHAKALQELGIQPAGVPHWEMVDPKGVPIGRAIDGSHWDGNTPEAMAPALGKFFGVGRG